MEDLNLTVKQHLSKFEMYAYKGEYLTKNEIFDGLRNKFFVPEEKIEEIKEVIAVYPMRISRYYWNLIKSVDDPIGKQCIPHIDELRYQKGEEDPLAEERDSPVSLITHRYPDRVLFLISDTCEMFCRFCTRKRKMGTPELKITKEKIDFAITYIREHTEVTDVILSGGDALCAPLARLEYVLKNLRAISHIQIIRIGTRVPCTNPKKITPELCRLLRGFHPIYINVHFEHPNEITPESINACNLLADSGFPLGNQNVLLRGVNDDSKTMAELYKKLLMMRVKPYYLFQADYVKGTNHFRTKVEKGLEIIQDIRGYISGLAIPHYVIDAPGGGGKIPLIPNYLKEINNEKVILTNYKGILCEYNQIEEK